MIDHTDNEHSHLMSLKLSVKTLVTSYTTAYPKRGHGVGDNMMPVWSTTCSRSPYFVCLFKTWQGNKSEIIMYGFLVGATNYTATSVSIFIILYEVKSWTHVSASSVYAVAVYVEHWIVAVGTYQIILNNVFSSTICSLTQNLPQNTETHTTTTIFYHIEIISPPIFHMTDPWEFGDVDNCFETNHLIVSCLVFGLLWLL